MKCEKIDDKARVWIVTLGADGKLHPRPDAELVAALCAGLQSPDVADVVAAAAGAAEVSETRLW
jgi:hypothetical protein